MLEHASPNEERDLITKMLPKASQWITAMRPFISRSPNPSIAITNSLGASLSLINPSSPDSIQHLIARDGDGYSSAFRMAIFSTKLIGSTKAFESITNDEQATLCKNIALFLQLAGDNLSISGSMPLWDILDQEQETEVIDLVAETQALLASWLHTESSLSSFISVAQQELLNDAKGLKAESYYSGRAYCAMTTEISETHGPSSDKSQVDRLKALRVSEDIFASAAYLSSAPDSKALQRLCNELLADLTGLNFEGSATEGMSN